MKTIYKISALVILFVALNSCEKVIDLELKDAKQQIVVDANIYNGAGNNVVILTKSGNFYESNDFETVKNASVIITSNTGETYVLREIENGIYNNDTLNGLTLTKYSLNISVGGKTISSNSTMPTLVPLDSISVELSDGFAGGGSGGGGGHPSDDVFYKLFINFTDPANEQNYYRIKTIVNGFEIPDIGVIDDGLFNGLTTKLPINIGGFTLGDVVSVNLISIDKANYEYYRLLGENDMSAMTTSAGNPVSNVKGEDVIGVFGANAFDSKSVTIE